MRPAERRTDGPHDAATACTRCARTWRTRRQLADHRLSMTPLSIELAEQRRALVPSTTASRTRARTRLDRPALAAGDPSCEHQRLCRAVSCSTGRSRRPPPAIVNRRESASWGAGQPWSRIARRGRSCTVISSPRGSPRRCSWPRNHRGNATSCVVGLDRREYRVRRLFGRDHWLGPPRRPSSPRTSRFRFLLLSRSKYRRDSLRRDLSRSSSAPAHGGSVSRDQGSGCAAAAHGR